MDFFSHTLDDLKNFLVSFSEKSFRAKQIFEWIYEKGVKSFEKMTNLSYSLRSKLEENFSLFSMTLEDKVTSKDQETVKYLWRLSDGFFIESVLIISENRRTVCVSTQVGCDVKCSFCASGKKGFFRNLSVQEIIEQVYQINGFLKEKNERVSNVVFMGMGEPLLNLENVVKAIELLNAKEAFNISQRRITLSTVGIVEGIESLIEKNLKINLVLSLHAPTQDIRKKIIPYSKKYPFQDILDACEKYFNITKRDITYEYTLISGVNDSKEQARLLANVLKDKQCSVNLIPYNPVEGIAFKRPEKETIEKFRSILLSYKIPTTWRYTKGKDINAACGQLALKK